RALLHITLMQILQEGLSTFRLLGRDPLLPIPILDMKKTSTRHHLDGGLQVEDVEPCGHILQGTAFVDEGDVWRSHIARLMRIQELVHDESSRFRKMVGAILSVHPMLERLDPLL